MPRQKEPANEFAAKWRGRRLSAFADNEGDMTLSCVPEGGHAAAKPSPSRDFNRRSLLSLLCLCPWLTLLLHGVCFMNCVQAASENLGSGKALLTLSPGGVRVSLGASAFRQAAPLAIEVVDAQGEAQWLSGGYGTVKRTGQAVACVGTLLSPHGTRFGVTDTYQPLPKLGAFTLTREVKIGVAGVGDAGFSSRFSLAPVQATAMTDEDFFCPALWYKQNAHVPPTALASHLDDRYYLFREDRLPLPVMMTRDRRMGATFTLAHVGGVPTTIPHEDGLARIIDARLGFGSLGILNTGDGPSPVFQFPGTEGERTYTFGGSREGNRWALRSHPVQMGFTQHYRLLLQLSQTADYPAAVRQTWKAVYDLANPPVIRAGLAKVYRDGVNLLSEYARPYGGVTGIPFQATVPEGVIKDPSSQMGFVGEALPAAWLLLQDGLARGDADAVARASAVVDTWAQNAPTPSGMPRTWYDVRDDGRPHFRDYHTFLRVASDGMDGALQAWNAMRKHGQDRPNWLAFCRRYGDWLVGAQNADGSWAREYDFDGKPVSPATDTTDQAIPFLADLFKATGDAKYKQSALRAGAFCWTNVHRAYAYVGGTPDNPNVTDKEAGMMALAAFLSLYDLTGEKRWLAAATQAAWYSETWVYCWNIPIPESDDPKVVFPKSRTTYGLSLIATGHSGSDTYMAAAPFLFYRVYVLTNETHFRDSARMLLYDTKQLLDWDGKLGYKYPGLQTEAMSLPPLRGHGVAGWLPWLTVTQLEPLVRLRDVFGSLDIGAMERTPRALRLKQDAWFARTHGFVSTEVRP